MKEVFAIRAKEQRMSAAVDALEGSIAFRRKFSPGCSALCHAVCVSSCAGFVLGHASSHRVMCARRLLLGARSPESRKRLAHRLLPLCAGNAEFNAERELMLGGDPAADT